VGEIEEPSDSRRWRDGEAATEADRGMSTRMVNEMDSNMNERKLNRIVGLKNARKGQNMKKRNVLRAQ
jgi:hypothetical protein